MAVYALSDLHLALSVDKPMDVFGSSWQNYMEKIRCRWCDAVGACDLVIVGGDVSWATYLDELTEDFSFLNSLPGQKLLLKGNHDYWWESVTKMKNFTHANGFDTISFLHNDAFLYEGFSVAGTRGWLLPGTDGFGEDDRRIYERELIRLKLSLDAAVRLEEKNGSDASRRIAVFHYPPVDFSSGVPDEEVMKLLREFKVKKCLYGHIHGSGLQNAFCGSYEGIEFVCTSADYLHFTPCKIDWS